MQPLTIGPRNAEAATGVTWRWIRDHAPELGVQVVRVDGKAFVLAAELLAALERYAGVNHGLPTDDHDAGDESADELASMRRRIARAG